MTLPWFAFDLDAYTANTMHLTTEEHGAYLLMMLAYYRTGKPLPASDRNLAALTKLTMERWLECKPTLAAFFTDDITHWRHERIEAELLEASSKHAKAVEKATNAARSKHRGDSPKHATSRPEAKKPPQVSSEDAPSTPQAEQQASSKDAHLHKHIHTLSSERVDARAQEGAIADSEGKLPGTFLDPNWSPDLAGQEFARSNGMATDEIIKTELLRFHDRCLEDGRVSNDWDASWRRWCARYLEIHPPPPPPPTPRVDVNASATVPDAASMQRSYELALQRWITDESGWPRQLGPSPGSINCRVPRELLDQYNIDPKTGQVIRQPTRKEAS